MQIGDLARRPAVTCHAATKVRQVARLLTQNEIGLVVVVDDDDRPIGVITDHDLISRVISAGKQTDLPVGEVMTREPATVAADRDVVDAAHQMAARDCRRLPVVDADGIVIGVISFDQLFERAAEAIEQLDIAVHQRRHPSIRSVA